MGVKFKERMELVYRIMEEMERCGFDQGEAEIFPRLLEETIRQNNERFLKEKPFVIFRD